MRKRYWHDKKILITGITGFVGGALAKRLVDQGARVIGIGRDEAAPCYLDVSGYRSKVTLVRGDLTDLSFVERVVNEYSAQVIYHLAAQAIVGVANRSPISTFRSNIEGTWNLLEACRGKNFIEAVIVASSDKAYGTHPRLPYREGDALLAQYPYDVSKACADMIARTYFKTYDLPVVVTRFANIYGPGDFNFSRIIPDAIRSVLAGKSPIIRSDGTPERDYLFIQDVIDLYLLLVQQIHITRGQVFNAGHNKPFSVKQVVETIIKVAGRTDLKPKITGKGNPHGEIDRQWLDGSKAQRLLKWVPGISLQEGIIRTLQWYQTHRDYL